jgi:hypothetical protein
MSPRTFDQAWPSRYLTAADLSGRSFTATIRSIEFEKMQDGSEKPVAYFNKVKKGVVLNKTKGKFLAGLAKSMKFDDWLGLEVQVREGITSFKGDEVACIKFERSEKQKAKEVKDALDGDGLPDMTGGSDEDDEDEDL